MKRLAKQGIGYEGRQRQGMAPRPAPLGPRPQVAPVRRAPQPQRRSR